MKRTEMVRSGAQMLVRAEDDIDTALRSTSELVVGLSGIRLESDLSAVLGHDAFESLAEAVALLTKARGAMVKTHGHLNDVKTRIGCATVADGTTKDKGDDPPIRTTGIRRVA
jgi:hypothetical protein